MEFSLSYYILSLIWVLFLLIFSQTIFFFQFTPLFINQGCCINVLFCLKITSTSRNIRNNSNHWLYCFLSQRELFNAIFCKVMFIRSKEATTHMYLNKPKSVVYQANQLGEHLGYDIKPSDGESLTLKI